MGIKEERNILEKMMENSYPSLEGSKQEPNSPPELESRPLFNEDVEEITKKCEKEAKKMIRNATGLMLTDEMIRNNPYLKNKMAMDIISLSGILYQLEVNIIMQRALMEEVRSGAAQPRMFEVFGALSKTIGELNKQLLATIEVIKVTYRDIKIDIENRVEMLKALGPGDGPGIIRNERGVISMGTKDLIREAKKKKIEKFKSFKEEEISDVEEMEV